MKKGWIIVLAIGIILLVAIMVILLTPEVTPSQEEVEEEIIRMGLSGMVIGVGSSSGNTAIGTTNTGIGSSSSTTNQRMFWSSCNDSDSGVNLYSFGEINAYRTIKSIWWFKRPTIREYSFEDKCVGNSGGLYEFYCDGNNPRINRTVCDSGCENGACILTINYHPADINQDFRINMSEAIGFTSNYESSINNSNNFSSSLNNTNSTGYYDNSNNLSSELSLEVISALRIWQVALDSSYSEKNGIWIPIHPADSDKDLIISDSEIIDFANTSGILNTPNYNRTVVIWGSKLEYTYDYNPNVDYWIID